MGPWSASMEEIRDKYVDDQLRMRLPGFEGEFLDADEVELYLRQRNIIIPSHKDSIEVEIDPSQFESDEGSLILRDPQTQQIAVGKPDDTSTWQMGNVAPTGWPGAGQDMSTGGDNTSNPNQGWASTRTSKIRATLDVDLLVEYLVMNSVCLGRTSGTRPKEVDRAVKAAIGHLGT